MDIELKDDDLSISQIALYASASFLIVSIMGIFVYISCSKKYQLNWFEKNLLENANENQELVEVRSRIKNSGSNSSINNLEDDEVESEMAMYMLEWEQVNGDASEDDMEEEKKLFLQQQQQNKRMMINGGDVDNSNDKSKQLTPKSPTGSAKSLTLSMGSVASSCSSNVVPIAGTSKHIVLAKSPVRPKISSMQEKLDHTKIDTTLYKKTMIPKNDDGKRDAINYRGDIQLAIAYDPHAGILSVRLIQAIDLQPRNFNCLVDPYAKIRLLPDKSNIWQTRIHKKTLNPVFDEDFVFEEAANAINRRTLEILLYDFNAYSRHLCMGGIKIALSEIDLSQRVIECKPLELCSDQDANIELGDLMISLSFLPSAQRLTVVLVKARNLRVVDVTRNTSDPYVKVSLVHGGKRIKKRKTSVYRNTISPVMNEALTFDVSREILVNSLIEFLVIHDSLLGSNEILGRILIGSSEYVRSEEREFYHDIFRSKSATARWISLADGKL